MSAQRPSGQRTNLSVLTSRAAGATWWSSIELSARYAVQFLCLIFLARLLSPADFGLIAMVLVFTTLAVPLVDCGLGLALIQKSSTTPEDESAAFWFCITNSLVITVIIWLAAPGIASFYSQPPLENLTRALACLFPLLAFASIPDAILAKRLEFRARARSELWSSVFAGVVAVGFAYGGLGVWSLVAQVVLAAAVRAILLWAYTGWRPTKPFRAAPLRGLFGFGGFMLMANILDIASTRVQSLVIGKLFDSQALGFYTVAQNTQQAPASFFGAVLNRVGLPTFSAVAGEREQARRALRASMRLAMFPFLPGMLTLAVLAGPAIGVLYGERWVPAAPILSLLALSAAFWPMHVLNLAALAAQGRSDLVFRLTVIKKTVLIVFVLAAARWGPIGVAAGVLASSVFAVFANAYYSGRLLGYGARRQLADQRGTVLLSVASAAAAFLVAGVMKIGLLTLLFGLAAAMATYLVSARMTAHPALGQIRVFWQGRGA